MVQVVFIHGVNVRKEPDPEFYNHEVADRKAAFAKHCFKNTQHTFHDPYWGGEGAKPDLGGLYLNTPAGSTLGFGGIGSAHDREPGGSEKRLLNAATSDFGGVLNTLSIMLSDKDASASDIVLAEQVADYLVSKEDDDGQVRRHKFSRNTPITPQPVNDLY